MQQISKSPLFPLGQIVATPGALAALEKAKSISRRSQPRYGVNFQGRTNSGRMLQSQRLRRCASKNDGPSRGAGCAASTASFFSSTVVCGSSSRPVISSAAPRISPPFHGRCTRAQTTRHRNTSRSRASGDACGGDLFCSWRSCVWPRPLSPWRTHPSTFPASHASFVTSFHREIWTYSYRNCMARRLSIGQACNSVRRMATPVTRPTISASLG